MSRTNREGQVPSVGFTSRKEKDVVLIAPSRSARLVTRAGLAVTAAAALILASLDLFTSVPQHTSSYAAVDYLFTADGFPFMYGLFAAVIALHSLQAGRDGRIGRIGAVIACVGFAAFIAPLTASLVSGDQQALGPVYVLAALTTLVGMVIFAVGMVRAHTLPWWAGPALAVTWIVGGPVGEGGPFGFRGSAVLLAAACVAVAVTLPQTGNDASPRRSARAGA